MFNNYEHDPPGNNDINLCAGPKERKALKEILEQHLKIFSAENFIIALHYAVSKQANSFEAINNEIETELLCAEDAEISFDKHLSDMCQKDVDKVFKHLKVLFIDRCGKYTGVYRLDAGFHYDDRKKIYEEIIVPWLNWVRSAGQDKSTTEVSDNTDIEVSDKSTVQSETNSMNNKSDSTDKKADKKENNKPNKKENNKPNIMSKSNIFNKAKDEFESQFESDPDAEITLYATEAEQYALQQALAPYMSSEDADELIREIHNELDDGLPAGDIRFSELSKSEVEDVLEYIDSLVTDEGDTLNYLKNFDDEQRENLYNDIIKPWFKWLRQNKKNSSKKANNKKTNNTTNKNKTDNTDTTNTMNNTNISKNNMFGSLASVFSNMLGTLEPDMVRMTFDGNIAVKTTKGYKTYNVAKKKAINMDSLVMPDMQAFLLLPSMEVKPGDIILRDGSFYSIISIDNEKGELEAYNYEVGKRENLVRETHCFLGNTYFYSKLFSPVLSFFSNKPKTDKKEEGSENDEASEDNMSMLLPLAMMSQNSDMNNLLPLMLMSKMEGKEESSGMMKMLMLSGMMGGSNSNMNNLLPLMLMSGNFPAI